MKYYLCKIGSFQDGGEEQIKDDCLKKNIYQYYKSVRQKGAGDAIQNGDLLILVFRKNIVAYGISCGCLGDEYGIDNAWQAVKVQEWIKAEKNISLPYGVWWHTLVGNKQSIVKEIDALWANDLITQIIMSNSNELMPKNSIIHLHLPSVASFLKNGFLAIPAVQRGKVWNAVRTEILWDSLLRGIPIGSLSIRPVENEKCWQLLDGQQRSNAIALGYMDFNKQSNSILWIDLGMNSAATEQNDGNIKQSNRKFFFRVTTQAHPWGYKLSDNETKNTVLSASEKRAAVHNIEYSGQKPLPFELWPVKTKFPVPFSLLRQYCEHSLQKTFADFWSFCEQKASQSNWFKHFNKNADCNNIIEWKTLCENIGQLNDVIIVAQNAISIPDEDVGLYFKRMNKAGIEPSDAEIRYSLLKSRIPELKKLDDIAMNRMQPSRMADIAMKTYFIIKQNKWKNNITNSDLDFLTSDDNKESWLEYIKSDFEEHIKTIESWLVYNEDTNKIGLPRFVYSSIARSNTQDIYSLLIFFAALEYNFNDEGDRKNLIALVTLICWFGTGKNRSAIASIGCDIYKRYAKDDWLAATRQWLFDSIKEHLLLLPPEAEIYERIQKETSNKNWDELQKAWNPLGYREALDATWHWTKKESRELLLYACREYMNKEFPEYDPADAVWCEENRPWDYDHIFPQSWLISGQGKKQGQYHELVETFLNSIGNIAPLPFSMNRAKNDDPPKEYKNAPKSLLITHTDFFNQNNKFRLEREQDKAYLFANITATRLLNLYSKWYVDLAVASLIDFSGIKDERKSLYEKIKQEYKGDMKCYYVVENNQQKEVTIGADWARPWLVVGCEAEYEGKKCLCCIASDGNVWEVGYRRHSNATVIDGDSNKWWFECHVFDKPEAAEKNFLSLQEKKNG